MIARAPCRVDLAGGTLDIWPLGLLHPGAITVNVAIDLEVSVELRSRAATYRVRQDERLVEGRTAADLAGHPEGELVGVVAAALGLPPFEATLRSDSPRGGGLGASSAMAVALIAAGQALIGEEDPGPAARAALARDLEARLMSLPTGRQDHYAALLGGALEIAHVPGGERVRRLAVDLAELGLRLLVVYSGKSHFSAASNWQIVKRRLDGDPETVGLFAGIAEVAAELPAALEGGDWERAGELMGREWSYRRHLADEISTPAIESLLGLATTLGAYGGKACGAGGGGCVALLCPPDRRAAIADTLTAAGGRPLATRPTAAALRVERE